MLTQTCHADGRKRGSGGFTLVELLVVVVVSGVLATVAIGQYSSAKEKAFNSAAKADVRNAMTSMESYFAQNQDYRISDVSSMPDFNPSGNVRLTVDGNGRTYVISARHISSVHWFYVCGGQGEEGRVMKGRPGASCNGSLSPSIPSP